MPYNTMLTQTVIDQNAENRRSQKVKRLSTQPAMAIEVIYSRIDPRNYEMLIQWMMQAASELRLTSSTRYLTRIYLDLALHNSLHIQTDHYIALAVTALSLAIKFNELREVGDQLTPQYLFQMAELEFTGDFYYDLESQIIAALRFRFKFTTPYDFIDGFCERFPWNINFKNALASILDLTLALPFCASFSTEELFYGTVETIFRAKNVNLNSTQKNVLLGITDTWQKASQLSELILNSINNFFAV